MILASSLLHPQGHLRASLELVFHSSFIILMCPLILMLHELTETKREILGWLTELYVLHHLCITAFLTCYFSI